MTIYDVRQGLRAYLLADVAIAALVAARVYPLKLPQGERATSIVYSRISGQGDHHNAGPSGLARPRIQIDSWALTAQVAVTLAALIKERIDGFKGAMPYGANSPQDQITVRGVFIEDEREGYDDTAALFRVSQDYFVWFAER